MRARPVVGNAVLALILAGLVTLPWLGGYFAIFLATEMLILGLFAASFNLLFGYTGLLSFGQAAYFGTGAYVAALLLRDVSPDFIWVLLAGPIVAGLLAAVIGWFCVRLTEVYFAMLTLAFGMMVYAVYHQWRGLTGGSDGVAGFRITPLVSGLEAVNLANPVHYYFLTLAVVVVCGYVLHRITTSPFGLILKSIRENAERAAFAGVPVRPYRLLAFTIAGFFAGVAGALFAPFNRIAVPEMVHWTMSAEPVLMTILGGSHNFLGPFLGAAVFLGLRTWLTSFTDQWMFYLGFILLFLVLFLPRGLLSLLDLRAWRRRR